MNTAPSHRGVEYSLTYNGGGVWMWTLHPSPQSNLPIPFTSGELKGTRSEAIRAAEAAIDALLAEKPK